MSAHARRPYEEFIEAIKTFVNACIGTYTTRDRTWHDRNDWMKRWERMAVGALETEWSGLSVDEEVQAFNQLHSWKEEMDKRPLFLKTEECRMNFRGMTAAQFREKLGLPASGGAHDARHSPEASRHQDNHSTSAPPRVPYGNFTNGLNKVADAFAQGDEGNLQIQWRRAVMEKWKQMGQTAVTDIEWEGLVEEKRAFAMRKVRGWVLKGNESDTIRQSFCEGYMHNMTPDDFRVHLGLPASPPRDSSYTSDRQIYPEPPDSQHPEHHLHTGTTLSHTTRAERAALRQALDNHRKRYPDDLKAEYGLAPRLEDQTRFDTHHPHHPNLLEHLEHLTPDEIARYHGTERALGKGRERRARCEPTPRGRRERVQVLAL